MTEADAKLRQSVLEALSGVLANSEIAPDYPAILSEVVIVAGWYSADGDEGWSWLGTRGSWSAEGLLRKAIRAIEDADTDLDLDE